MPLASSISQVTARVSMKDGKWNEYVIYRREISTLFFVSDLLVKIKIHSLLGLQPSEPNLIQSNKWNARRSPGRCWHCLAMWPYREILTFASLSCFPPSAFNSPLCHKYIASPFDTLRGELTLTSKWFEIMRKILDLTWSLLRYYPFLLVAVENNMHLLFFLVST